MPDDLLAHNRQLIDQFRADGGASMTNRPLLLLTTAGRRTGQPRTSPIMYVRHDDRLLVIASNKGAATDPLWFRNLIADPVVTVELPGESFTARATPLTGDDYDAEWTRLISAYPFFAEYQAKAGDRTIPLVELSRLV